MIFKSTVDQAHGRKETLIPGFGCKIGEAVRASCSAYPYFDRYVLKTGQGITVELFDGGYCANNPTLYAIADAVKAFGKRYSELRVLSVGVGIYPSRSIGSLRNTWRRGSQERVSALPVYNFYRRP